MTLDANDFLMALLNGNLSDHCVVPRAIGEKFKGQDGIVVEDDPADPFVTLWHPFGWENELRRREYFATVTGPAQVKPMLTKIKAGKFDEYI